MNGVNDMEEAGSLSERAAGWVIRVHSEAATEGDWLSLEAWLASSPDHVIAFTEAEALWLEYEDRAGELRQLMHVESAANIVELPTGRARRRSIQRWAPPAAVAASLAIGLIGAWLIQPFGPAAQVYATQFGQTRSIVLRDGSHITLNSASRLTAQVDLRYRHVTLNKGEAIFDVAKDQSHPFIVGVGDRDVTVVGTEFDILRYAGHITVTVSRGIVAVKPRQGETGQSVRLVAGDQLSHVEDEATSDLIRTSAGDVLAWRDGYAVYTNRALADVAADLSRYFPIPIVARGPAAHLIFTGTLRIDKEAEVIRRLEAFLPISAVSTPRAIVLQAR